MFHFAISRSGVNSINAKCRRFQFQIYTFSNPLPSPLCNLRWFMIIHQIDSFNLKSNFFSKRQFNSKFFDLNWIENDNIIAMLICFEIFPRIYWFSTISTSKLIIYLRAKMIVFQWFYLGRLHRPRLPLWHNKIYNLPTSLKKVSQGDLHPPFLCDVIYEISLAWMFKIIKPKTLLSASCLLLPNVRRQSPWQHLKDLQRRVFKNYAREQTQWQTLSRWTRGTRCRTWTSVLPWSRSRRFLPTRGPSNWLPACHGYLPSGNLTHSNQAQSRSKQVAKQLNVRAKF